MHEMLHPLSEIRTLQDPLLIAGFADHTGTTAASTIAYLGEHWDAEPLAEIDIDQLFDFTSRRPIVHIEGGERVLQWPTSRLYLASPDGAARDVVLLAGTEPHLRWRLFCEVIASFMHEVGGNTSLVLGSYPGSTPHTRAVPVRISASDEAYGRSFGLEPTTSNYQGPTGIAGVLSIHQRSEGFRTASLSTMTPFYVPTDRDPNAMIALIAAIDLALGTSTPLEALQERAAKLDAQADEAVQESDQLSMLVQSMEQQTDWLRGSSAQPAPNMISSDLPSSSEVIESVERFLSQQRDADSSSANGKAAPA